MTKKDNWEKLIETHNLMDSYKKLIKTRTNLRNEVLVGLLALGGLRLSEALKIQVGNPDDEGEQSH